MSVGPPNLALLGVEGLPVPGASHDFISTNRFVSHHFLYRRKHQFWTDRIGWSSVNPAGVIGPIWKCLYSIQPIESSSST